MLFRIKDLDTLLEVKEPIRCKDCLSKCISHNPGCVFCAIMRKCVAELLPYLAYIPQAKIIPLTYGKVYAKSQPKINTRKRNKQPIVSNRYARELS